MPREGILEVKRHLILIYLLTSDFIQDLEYSTIKGWPLALNSVGKLKNSFCQFYQSVIIGGRNFFIGQTKVVSFML